MSNKDWLLYPHVNGLSARLREKLEKGAVEFEAGGYIGNDGEIRFTHVALIPVKEGDSDD